MKIVYLGGIPFTDMEFPLIREFQKQDCDIVCYYHVYGKSCRGGLFNIENVKKTDAIIKASEYEPFRVYEGYLDLDKIYIINNYHTSRWHFASWLVWIKFIWHAKKWHPNIFHFVWPFSTQLKILYLWKICKVMTVHNPLPHSSQISKKNEDNRRKSFKACKKLILLSESLKDNFKRQYGIQDNKIVISKLGLYDCINFIGHKVRKNGDNKQPYILFFGYIDDYKGVDILLEAMTKVHTQLPELNCIIAGKGKFSFDIEQYSKMTYIEIRNYFIPLEELADLLQNCIFSVCPYKDATQSGVIQTSFSAGVPVVVTDVGAFSEYVKDGEMGIVVPPNNVNLLAEAICRLAKQKDLREFFIKNIENVWKKEMAIEPIVRQYIQMYRSVINRNNI